MSIDLTEAVQAAAEGFCSELALPTTFDDLTGIQKHVIREHALTYVKHAAPLIEAAVRGQVAREIDDHAGTRPNDYGTRWIAADTAARIARGERP